MSKTIPLTQDQEAIVDDWWYDYLTQWKWYAKWDKHTESYYAVRNVGKSPHQKNVFMHRVVSKTPEGMQCDHIHHNTLDNREIELRNVTSSKNGINKKPRKSNKFGVPGVTEKRNGSFMAQLVFERKHVLHKTFKTVEEAIQSRLDAEKKYFGEFANK